MLTRVADVLVILALGGTAGGCALTSLYRSAEPTPRGTWQLTGGGAVGVLRDSEQDTRIPSGQVELGVRYGVTDELDLGARVFVPGVDVNATWRVAHRGAWSVALAPQFAVVRTPATGLVTNSLTLFSSVAVPVTHRFSRDWALTVGPSFGTSVYFPETGGSATGMWLGGVLGVEARVGERWWLVPELSGYRTAAGDVPVNGGAILFGVGLRVAL